MSVIAKFAKVLHKFWITQNVGLLVTSPNYSKISTFLSLIFYIFCLLST